MTLAHEVAPANRADAEPNDDEPTSLDERAPARDRTTRDNTYTPPRERVMTQPSNFNQATHQNQDMDKPTATTAHEIELEIGETRTAITSDAVVDKALEMKDTAAEAVMQAKDVVVETLEDAGEQAMRVGSATWRFTKANAVPLALFGAGAAWLVANGRRPRDSYQRTENPYAVADGASRGAAYVQSKFRRAGAASRDFAEANPLLVATAVLATGIGVGILMPSTDRESQLLAAPRAKFQRLIGDVQDAVVDVAQMAKGTANESLNALT